MQENKWIERGVEVVMASDFDEVMADRDRLAERCRDLELMIANKEQVARVGRLLDMEQRLATADAELKTYREGGVTEEILRRNDGYIKVGRGCVIVREDEWNTLSQRLAEIEQKYNELIYAVGNKYENESRHETALRYIREREQPKDIHACEQAKQALEVRK